MKHPLLILCLLLFSQISSADKLNIANFSQQDLSGWENKVFNNNTSYTFVKDKGVFVLKAQSNQSASGKFIKKTINIKKYPYLNWRWKLQQPLNIKDESIKQGDDYSARIYIIKSGGLFFWKTKTLNYVWASQHQTNSHWPNPYAPNNAIMLATRSKADALNIWYSEKRNVYQDFKKVFGDDIDEIDGIAIMTDTDDSKGKAIAYFGDIYFSEQ